MGVAQFVKSAVHPSDYPAGDRPEVALCGRSNSGKSTLLNAMTGSKVAKVSATPGKTRLLNFFNVGIHYRIVDLPGYGYAARDESERRMWGRMIADFFEIRENLVGLIIVCDMRRRWSGDEQQLVDLASARGLECLCVLTKKDKLSRSVTERLFSGWRKTSGKPSEFFHPVSALKKSGVEELEDYIFKEWVKPLIGRVHSSGK